MGVLVCLSIRGIRPSVWVQTAFIVIEYSAMISFVVLALIHESSGAGGATLPSLSDFTVSHAVAGVGGFKGLAEAAVPCGFLYLGWEATAVLGEESTHRNINPGRAMLLGTGFLTIWYTFLIVVFQGVSSQAQVLAHGTDVLAYAGTLLVPGFLGRALPARRAHRRDRHLPDPDDRAEPDPVRAGQGQGHPARCSASSTGRTRRRGPRC